MSWFAAPIVWGEFWITVLPICDGAVEGDDVTELPERAGRRRGDRRGRTPDPDEDRHMVGADATAAVADLQAHADLAILVVGEARRGGGRIAEGAVAVEVPGVGQR